MSNRPEILYTAEATATGGREGHARTSDGRLEVDLDVPSEMGGPGGPGRTRNSCSRQAMRPASSQPCCGSPPAESSTSAARGSLHASESGRSRAAGSGSQRHWTSTRLGSDATRLSS